MNLSTSYSVARTFVGDDIILPQSIHMRYRQLSSVSHDIPPGLHLSNVDGVVKWVASNFEKASCAVVQRGAVMVRMTDVNISST